MTRREEIEQQASLTVFPWDDVREQSKFEDGFIEGAKWADKTMIEKACQWIESYLFDIGFPDDWCRDSATMKSGKQRFLEAMEE
jgi:hypothetical protein